MDKIKDIIQEYNNNHLYNEELTTTLYYIPTKQDKKMAILKHAKENRKYKINQLLQYTKEQEFLKKRGGI